MNAELQISVIICTRNRAAFLKPCIESVLEQDMDASKYEIIVVDNDSSDETSAIAQSFTARGVRYIMEKRLGLSVARNTGVVAAAGRYAGFLDDDAVAVDGWLQGVEQAFHEAPDDVIWVGGAIDLDPENPLPSWIGTQERTALGWLDLGGDAHILGPGERLGGGNSFFDKGALQRLGGFDERLGRQKNKLLSGEETQLQMRAVAAGYRLFYQPEIRIRHFVSDGRMQPAFFYSRFYWGGVTDCYINRTVRRRMDLPTAGDPMADENRVSWSGRLSRMLSHLFYASGLGGRERMIQSRIYYSYVLGWIYGLYYSSREN